MKIYISFIKLANTIQFWRFSQKPSYTSSVINGNIFMQFQGTGFIPPPIFNDGRYSTNAENREINLSQPTENTGLSLSISTLDLILWPS